ncbi:hypothetical protein FACS189465_3220 [Clostridia bacterium]|nr:hypothetical protein FACS189465_3220 [Clostridia bacterium]
METLIKNGAKVDFKNDCGDTALDFANRIKQHYAKCHNSAHNRKMVEEYSRKVALLEHYSANDIGHFHD